MFFITGGAGFIGSNIAAALEERRPGGVVVCDSLGSGDKWRNLAKRELAGFVQPGELFNYLEDREGEVEAIIHMAAISTTTETDADLIVTSNFNLSLDLWEWCVNNDVPFIYASSAATYGDGSQGFDDDPSPAALARLRPLNAYAWSKHLFDRRVARLVEAGGPRPPQWVGLKFFNVYGPNEYHKGGQISVAAQIYRQAAADQAARLFESHNPDYENGGQSRDFVWIDDCVDVVTWLIDNRNVSGIFNCGRGQASSFAELAGAVFEALGEEPNIEYQPTPEAIRDRYQYFTQAEMGRLAGAGYDKSFTSLEDGVKAYVQGYLAATDPYR